MTDERRSADRTPLHGEVPGEVTIFQRMTLLDLSEDGVRIEAPFSLQHDSLHDFRLNLGEQSVVLKGRVVHCAVGEIVQGEVRYRSGMEFVDPSPHAVEAIRGFLAARRKAETAVLDPHDKPSR